MIYHKTTDTDLNFSMTAGKRNDVKWMIGMQDLARGKATSSRILFARPLGSID